MHKFVKMFSVPVLNHTQLILLSAVCTMYDSRRKSSVILSGSDDITLLISGNACYEEQAPTSSADI